MTTARDSPSPSSPPIEIVNGRRTPDALRNHAYALWAWEHGRDAKAVADELAVEPRTVQRWVRQDGWHQRYATERAEVAPASYRAVVDGTLRSAALYAAAYLEAVTRGEVPPDKLRIHACQIVLDRAGYAPIHLHLHNERTQPPQLPPDLAALSTEELAARVHAELGYPAKPEGSS